MFQSDQFPKFLFQISSDIVKIDKSILVLKYEQVKNNDNDNKEKILKSTNTYSIYILNLELPDNVFTSLCTFWVCDVRIHTFLKKLSRFGIRLKHFNLRHQNVENWDQIYSVGLRSGGIESPFIIL